MNKIINYANELIRNHPLDNTEYSTSENYSDAKINMFGGANNTNKPTGGFPPIYVCDKETEEQKDKEVKPKREYKTVDNTPSIKNILEKRRDVKPFIPI